MLGEIASRLGDTQTSEPLLQQPIASHATYIAPNRKWNFNRYSEKTLHQREEQIYQSKRSTQRGLGSIVQNIKDQEWASKVYDGLSSTFANDVDTKRFKAEKAFNLERAFW